MRTKLRGVCGIPLATTLRDHVASGDFTSQASTVESNEVHMFGADSENGPHDGAIEARVAEAKSRIERSQMAASDAEGHFVAIGVLALLIGLYFLLVPSGDSVEFGGRSMDVVNLHRLYIGQTSTIVGAMFLLAGLRRR